MSCNQAPRRTPCEHGAIHFLLDAVELHALESALPHHFFPFANEVVLTWWRMSARGGNARSGDETRHTGRGLKVNLKRLVRIVVRPDVYFHRPAVDIKPRGFGAALVRL